MDAQIFLDVCKLAKPLGAHYVHLGHKSSGFVQVSDKAGVEYDAHIAWPADVLNVYVQGGQTEQALLGGIMQALAIRSEKLKGELLKDEDIFIDLNPA
jgi:hypothetical protein